MLSSYSKRARLSSCFDCSITGKLPQSEHKIWEKSCALNGSQVMKKCVFIHRLGMTTNDTEVQCSDKKNTNLILFILYMFYRKLLIFPFDS